MLNIALCRNDNTTHFNWHILTVAENSQHEQLSSKIRNFKSEDLNL